MGKSHPQSPVAKAGNDCKPETSLDSLCSPLFKEVTLRVGGDKTFRIVTTKAVADGASFSQFTKRQPHSSKEISYAEIIAGGVLEIELGDRHWFIARLMIQ